jgi:hypothetical protein
MCGDGVSEGTAVVHALQQHHLVVLHCSEDDLQQLHIKWEAFELKKLRNREL